MITALKRMIDTASFVIPSPKTSEKSLGYFSGLMSEMAAITSVAHRRLHMQMISRVLNSKGEVTPVLPLVCVIYPPKKSL